MSSDALRQQYLPRARHRWVNVARSAAVSMLGVCLLLVGLNCLLAGPSGGYAVIVGQALVVTSAFLAPVAVHSLAKPPVLRVSRIASALLVVVFIGFESLGPAHGHGYSPTGTLVFRALAEARYTPADLARYFRLQLPPSAGPLRSLDTLTWNGDGQIYFRFDLDSSAVPGVLDQLTGTGTINLDWQVESIGAPVDWWDIDGLSFEQSTSNQWFRYAIREHAGRATLYLVFENE